MSERPDFAPFKEGFQAGSINQEHGNGGGPSLVREFESNPEKVVRVHTLDSSYLPPAPDGVHESRFFAEEAAKLIKKTESAFQTFNQYVDVPKHEYVLGDSPTYKGFTTIYTVVDKVEGRNLIDELGDPESKLSNEALENFYLQLIRYYLDQSRSGSDILTDAAKHRQYMFGHTLDDPTDKIHMVDLDFFTGSSNQESTFMAPRTSLLAKAAAGTHVQNSLGSVSHMLNEAERLRGIKFTKAWRLLAER